MEGQRILVVYLRVSTRHQDMERQEAQVRRAEADADGLEVVVLREPGVSAFKVPVFDRPEGAKLVALVEQGRVEAVYVDAVDRLTRGEDVEWVTFRALCESQGTRIVVDGREVAADLGGRLEGYLKALLARQESVERSHRMKSSLPAAVRKHGRRFGGRRKYGRRPDGRILEREAQVIRERIVPAHLAGLSELRIARDLDAASIPAAQGGPWAPSAIAGILRRPDLAGLVRLDGDLIDGSLEPIVDRDTWTRAQAVYERRRSGPERRGRIAEADFLLASPITVTCCVCAAPMRRRSGNRRADGSRSGSYVCSTRLRHGPGGCPMPAAPRELIDGAVLRVFEKAILDQEGTYRAFVKAAAEAARDTRKALAAAQRDVLRVQAQLDRVKGLFRDGSLTAEEWRGEREEIEADLAAAEAEADRLRDRAEAAEGRDAARAAAEALAATVDDLRELAGTLRAEGGGGPALAAVRAALSEVVEEVVVVHLPTFVEADEFYLGSAAAANDHAAGEGVPEGDPVTTAVRLHMTDRPGLAVELVARRDLGRPVRDADGILVPPLPGRAALPPTENQHLAEVKEKRGQGFGDPLAMVTPEKQRRVRRAAEAWLAANPELARLEIGFDVVAVRGGRVERVQDAF